MGTLILYLSKKIKMKATIFTIVALMAQNINAIQYRPTEGSVPWHIEQTGPTWRDPKWPVNYVVPNFGKDQEIIKTEKSISEVEKAMDHKLAATFDKPKAPPREYLVPNFGLDHEIVTA